MALRKEPERRYGSVEQLAGDIERSLAFRPITARADSHGYRAITFLRRHRLPAGLSFAFALVLLGLAASFVLALASQAQRVARERDRAEEVSSFLVDLFSVADPGAEIASTVTARELLDRGAARAVRELEGQPTVQATMLNTVGEIYRRLGLNPEARDLLEDALEIWQRQAVGAEPHPQRASTLLHLGKVMIEAGEMEQAERLLQEALTIDRAARGRRHPRTAQILTSLAQLRHRLYDFEGAEAMGREALAIQRTTLQPDDRRVAESLFHLGRIHLEKGDWIQAEGLFREALSLRQRALGEEHPDFAVTLVEIGQLFYARGALDRTEGFLREALAIQQRVLGEDRPEVADTLRRLGGVLSESGRYEEAERFMRTSVAIQRMLAAGERSTRLAETLGDLGIVLNYRGSNDEALATLAEAREMLIAIYGHEHPMVAASSQVFARVHHERGETQLALAYYRESAELSARLLPPGHRFTAYPMIGWSELLLETGEIDRAEQRIRQALAIFSASLPSDHWRIAHAETVLGGVLLARGRVGQAAPLLRRGYPVLAARRSPASMITRKAAAWLLALDQQGGEATLAIAMQSGGFVFACRPLGQPSDTASGVFGLSCEDSGSRLDLTALHPAR